VVHEELRVQLDFLDFLDFLESVYSDHQEFRVHQDRLGIEDLLDIQVIVVQQVRRSLCSHFYTFTKHLLHFFLFSCLISSELLMDFKMKF